MKRWNVMIGSLIIGLSLSSGFAQTDSLLLDFDSFLEIVEEHHPLSLQADLKLKEGAALLGRAKGAFDPKLYADQAKKSFDGKNYYDLFEGGVKIPTWFGLEFTTAFEQNSGIFLNPEETVPDAGLLSAGVSLPIGQGLLIDKRRAAYKKAILSQSFSEAERRRIRNELFYEAGKSYWDWFRAFHSLRVYASARELAKERLAAVKQGAVLGDRAMIDTLEASIQVQNRILSWQLAEQKYFKAQAMLELFLWQNGEVPLELTERVVPPASDTTLAIRSLGRLGGSYDSLLNRHPILEQSRLKLDQMSIEQRWKREQLKPKLNLKYNFLLEPVGNNWVNNFSSSNYTYGFSFSMPLFLRKERNELKLNKLKIQTLQYELSQKQESFSTKVRIAEQQLENTYRQAGVAKGRVSGYRELLEGERRMFGEGESSLFMINSRESSYIQAQIKYLEILAKNAKAGLELKYRLAFQFAS